MMTQYEGNVKWLFYKKGMGYGVQSLIGKSSDLEPDGEGAIVYQAHLHVCPKDTATHVSEVAFHQRTKPLVQLACHAWLGGVGE
jgi:hypothetical protein